MDFTFFNQLLLILALSAISIALFHRLNLPESLSYLAVGIILGPTATGLIDHSFDISLLAEIGVVFLLFTLGLEFSFNRIKNMKREVFGLGGTQVILTMTGIFAVLMAFNGLLKESLIVAAALALSSTAIVSKELKQSNNIRNRQGQLAIGVLLFQDIAAVFFLILVPALAGGNNQSILTVVSMALAKGGLFLAIMMVIGKWVLPSIFREVARTRSEELFVLTALMIALMAAWLTHVLSLSMALGGFVAGMIMGESNYKHQVEADIRPFRDILLGLFFVSVGLMLDLNILIEFWDIVLLGTLSLILFKLVTVSVLARLMREEKATALKAGLALSQGGEFCFALIALATQYGETGGKRASIVLAVTILSMMVAPLLIRNSERISQFFFRKKNDSGSAIQNLAIEQRTFSLQKHTVICGYGRVGQTISRFLAQENLPFVALDDDPLHVHEARLAGEPVFYGDCRRIELLQSLGLSRSRQIIICINNSANALKIVSEVRTACPQLPIMVRTRDASHTKALKKAGADVVIPEVLESSLLIVKHALIMLGIDRVTAKNKINAVREQKYDLLSAYYPGYDDVYADQQGNTQRHAVTIEKDSTADGLLLSELPLEDGVHVIEVKRRGQLISITNDTRAQSQDLVILSSESYADLQQSEKNFQ